MTTLSSSVSTEPQIKEENFKMLHQEIRWTEWTGMPGTLEICVQNFPCSYLGRVSCNISASNVSRAHRCNATIMTRPRPFPFRFMYQLSIQRCVIWVTNKIIQLNANEVVLAYRQKMHQEVLLLDDMKTADQTPSWRRGSEENNLKYYQWDIAHRAWDYIKILKE